MRIRLVRLVEHWICILFADSRSNYCRRLTAQWFCGDWSGNLCNEHFLKGVVLAFRWLATLDGWRPLPAILGAQFLAVDRAMRTRSASRCSTDAGGPFPRSTNRAVAYCCRPFRTCFSSHVNGTLLNEPRRVGWCPLH
jgi:hypothetical protein